MPEGAWRGDAGTTIGRGASFWIRSGRLGRDPALPAGGEMPVPVWRATNWAVSTGNVSAERNGGFRREDDLKGAA